MKVGEILGSEIDQIMLLRTYKYATMKATILYSEYTPTKTKQKTHV